MEVAASGLGCCLQIWPVMPVVQTELVQTELVRTGLEPDCGSGNP